MRTISLQISDELAKQLAPYQEQWPLLLAIGLQTWQQKQRVTNGVSVNNAQIQRVLAASDLIILPTPESKTTPYARQTPVPITGTPVSEIIIEQRGER